MKILLVRVHLYALRLEFLCKGKKKNGKVYRHDRPVKFIFFLSNILHEHNILRDHKLKFKRELNKNWLSTRD